MILLKYKDNQILEKPLYLCVCMRIIILEFKSYVLKVDSKY
jgi:hypothetical protein